MHEVCGDNKSFFAKSEIEIYIRKTSLINDFDRPKNK